jgi:hypothetical protein
MLANTKPSVVEVERNANTRAIEATPVIRDAKDRCSGLRRADCDKSHQIRRLC